MSETITRDEWLRALGEARIPLDPTAITVMELAAMLGVGREAAYRRILRLMKEGKATATRKMVTFTSGVTKPVAAYKLVNTPPRRKK